jgi:hypothetical protein
LSDEAGKTGSRCGDAHLRLKSDIGPPIPRVQKIGRTASFAKKRNTGRLGNEAGMV